jgi:molybdopterin/thiamine biosynthesis adenylyltransferase
MLTDNEIERYDRQIVIDGLGREGQERLKRARVVIAGSGGLGSAVSMYLVAAGVGTIRLIDHDKVELSNLNRQVLHWDKDVGRRKVVSASEKLSSLNPGVTIEAVDETINEGNVERLVAGFDMIVDAMDNFPVRLMLNKAALDRNIPFFYGGVHGFEGRAMTIIPGRTACLKCVYHGSIPGDKIPVIGATPAIIGSIQATEVIKYIVGIGELLADTLLVYNGLDMEFTRFRVKKDPGCEHCGKWQNGGKNEC